MEKFKQTPEKNKVEEKTVIETNENIEKDGRVLINNIKDDKFEKIELRKLEDQNKINNIKEEINKSTEKRKGYSFSLKPENIWNKKDEEQIENLVNRITNIFKRFSKKEIEKRKNQKNNENDFVNDSKKYALKSFDYKPGDGVLGMICNQAGILANNFRNCSALIFQGEKNTSVIHISPEALNHYSDFDLKDINIQGHVRSALRELTNSNLSSKRTTDDSNLNQNEIEELQKLFDSGLIKASMIHGEKNFSLELPITFATRANINGLPFFKTDNYYIGSKKLGTEFSVYANPKNIYIIGENNRIMKKGVDFPPTMIDFKERS